MLEEEEKRTYPSYTTMERTGHGNVYIVVSVEDNGYPHKVACYIGSTSPCDKANSEGVTNIINLLLKRRADPSQILAHLKGIECCPAAGGAKSVPDAIGRVLERHLFPPTTE